jgi:hypothetical protein
MQPLQPPPPDDDIQALTAPRVPHALDYVGLAATLLPFMISIRSSSSASVTTTIVDEHGNKQVTSSSNEHFMDPVALGGGALGILAAVATVLLWRKTLPSKRAARIGLTLGVLALGALQLFFRSGILS